MTRIKQLLEVLFEGHEVRYAIINERPVFIARDVCEAIQLSKPRDAIARLSSDEGCPVLLDTLGGPQEFTALTESGLYHLFFLSRKPAAARFRLFVTQEVLPQVMKYGTYVEGATPAERCALLYKRYKLERRGEITLGEAALADSRLVTVREFRQVHAIPAHDALAFAATLCQSARDLHERPRRFFTQRGQVNAWSLSALFSALGRYQPRLFFQP